MLKPMKHQKESLKFMEKRPRVFDMSDPGTGKTGVQILDFERRHKKSRKALLVLCPKSLMKAAWANDIKKFAPTLKVGIAWAKNRQQALTDSADVYILNHDGVRDLLKFKPAFWQKFEVLVIDESTAFKHHTSARSRAVAKIVKHFKVRRMMCGTPDPNGICDLWHQFFLVDDGKRLGKHFQAFRSAACVAVLQGKPQWVAEKNRDGSVKRDPETGDPIMKELTRVSWVDKKGIETVVAGLVSDITIRHVFEECVDIPKNHAYVREFDLTPAHMKKYKQLERDSIADYGDGRTVTAVHAASLRGKLLQVASGAVYNDDGDGAYSTIESERYELTLDIVEERKHSIVFYLWKHQLELMIKGCEARGISYVVWNPDRPEIEQEYQAGFYQVLFAHPKSAAHGLTLTRGTATIWPSPTDNLEWYIQGNKRIYRIGQKFKSETIVIVGKGTVDEKAWLNCSTKNKNMNNFFTEIKEAA